MTAAPHSHPHHNPDSTGDPTAFWEGHYTQRAQVWSGRPNAGLVARVAGLPTGRALDLGCGEGADAIWLAEQGWQVTAVDISQTALDRARSRARSDGVESRIYFQQHNLGETFPAGEFDLVSLQFLQSPVALAADELLHHAAGAVAADGLLLVVYHGQMPPRAGHAAPDGGFPTPEQTWAATGADADAWTVEELGSAEREATGPDGEVDVHIDYVVAARRTPPV